MKHMRKILWLIVAAVLLNASIAAESPELPSTQAGKVLRGYLEALNTGDKAKLEAFVKAHRPDRPAAVDIMLDLRWNTGGLDLHSVESSQPLNIQAVLLEREGGRYNRMSVSVSDGNPAVITNISLVVIPPPPGAPVPERLSESAAIAAWEAEIDKAARMESSLACGCGRAMAKWSPPAPKARPIVRGESTTRRIRGSESVL
jgi:hypothetical protein